MRSKLMRNLCVAMVAAALATTAAFACGGCGKAATDKNATVTVFPAGTVFTCPMHPEVKSDQPGKCPKCGMNLEPVKEKGTASGTAGK